MKYDRQTLLFLNNQHSLVHISDLAIFRLKSLDLFVSPKSYFHQNHAVDDSIQNITTIIGRRPPKRVPPKRTPVLSTVSIQVKQQNTSQLLDSVTNIKCPKTAKLKIILLNCQSSRQKTVVINDLITEQKADIVFLTETWIRPKGDEVLLHELAPGGFSPVSFPRGSRGGGICVVSKTSLHVKCKPTKSFKTFEHCECHIESGGTTNVFVCIYRPPPNKRNGFKTSEFLVEFQDLLDSYNENKIKPMILGDFNLHYENQRDNNVKTMKSIIESHAYIQHINTSTHNKKHTLEWVLTDINTPIYDLLVEDKCISDHFVITFNINSTRPKFSRDIISRRKVIDEAALCSDIKQLIPDLLRSDDKLHDYNCKLKQIMEKHAPMENRTVTDRPSAPWMTPEIKAAKAERRRAERHWKKTGLEIHKQLFRKMNNKVKQLMKTARAKFYNTKITECKTSRALFSLTKELSGSGSSSSDNLPSGYPKADLLDVFGQYFVDKVATIRTNLDAQPHKKPKFELFKGNEEFCTFIPVTVDDVKNIVKSSPPKSCCLDPILTPLLFKYLDDLAPIITDIINQSLITGTVPESFKHAVVIPLLKKSNLSHEDLKNFRPVSNLPFLSKILEKCVFSPTNESSH